VTLHPAKSARASVLEGKRERYEVVRPLAEGGFGITHLARRMRDGEEVVIKQLRMERLDDWKAFDLFEREAAVLEGLRHPNIPAFVDHFDSTSASTHR
jgi:serine/threonine protein kinase